MEHKIVFATSNAGKMREIREILKDLGAEILSMKEAGVDIDIVEDGDTFAANALIKAKAVWEKTGGIVLADDSGLVIDALNGEPGVYSARYMGEKTSYEIKNWNLIHRLDGVPEKNYWTQQILTPATGQFVSMIVMWRNKYDPSESESHFYSVFKGHASEKSFIKMYESPVSLFSADLPDMYTMAEGMNVK